MPPRGTTRKSAASDEGESKKRKIEEPEPEPEPEVESSEDEADVIPAEGTSKSTTKIQGPKEIDPFPIEEEGNFYDAGNQCQLSRMELEEMGIPHEFVANLKYGERYTSFLGFPLLSFPSDTDGLVLGYSSEIGENFFFTPTSKYPGGITEPSELPESKALALKEGARFTVQFFRLSEIFIYSVTALRSTGKESHEDVLESLAERLTNPHYCLDAKTLSMPRMIFFQSGGKPLKNLPPAEAQKYLDRYPNHPSVRNGMTPIEINCHVKYYTYFKNGVNFIQTITAPTTNKHGFTKIASLYDYLGNARLTSFQKAYNKGIQIKNPEILRYKSPYKAANKTYAQCAGELLKVWSWGTTAYPKVCQHLNAYFSSWINDTSKVHRGVKNSEPNMAKGLPQDVNYTVPIPE